MKAEYYTEELRELNGIPIRIITYKAGEEYHCHVANVDPGAVIARASSQSVDEAKQKALKKATERLKR